MRRPTFLLAALVLLAGCGSSSHNSTSTTSQAPPASTSTTTPSTTTSSPTPTKAQATAAGQAINLTSADLPGFKSTPSTRTAADIATDTRLAKCTGTSPPSAAIARVQSDTFTHGSGLQEQQVSSTVETLPSASTVSSDLAAIRTAHARTCVGNELSSLVRQSGGSAVKFGPASISSLASPAAGSDGSWGFRVTVPGKAGSTSFQFVVDLYGVAVGRLEISLSTLAIGQPIPASTEQRLLSTLTTRGVAHKI
jgi:hypothetical protein